MGLEYYHGMWRRSFHIPYVRTYSRIYGGIMKIEKWVDDIEDEVPYKYVYTKPEDRGYVKAPITSKQFYSAVPSFDTRSWLGKIAGVKVDVYYNKYDDQIRSFYAEQTVGLFGKFLLVLFIPIMFLYIVFAAGFSEFIESYKDTFWAKKRGVFMCQSVTQRDTKAFDKLMAYYVDYTR